MKKYNLKMFLCLLLLSIGTFGFSQKKKVAVVTFYSGKIIEFGDLGIGSEALMTNIFNLRDDPNFNLAPLLEKYHQNFFNEYSKALPFDLLPENQVVESEKYKAFVPKFQLDKYDARDYQVYDKYKYIYEGVNGKENEEGLAKLFADEADGVMFINITFALQKGFGYGGTASVKMRATTRIALYNKKGEKVFAFTEGENSKKTSMMVGGVPVLKPEKILPMCESALEELMGDLRKRLTKIAAKSDAKL